MRKRYMLLYVVIFLAYIFVGCEKRAEREIDYYAKADNLNLARIVDCRELTAHQLVTRNGDLIIERVIGVVDNHTSGDGHELENEEAYISYRCVDGISNGDVICTYFVYNPNSNAIDDIIGRYDYIISK